jgi:hypothetical protein
MHRRRVRERPTTYVCPDVHIDTTAFALAEAGIRSDVREHRKIPETPAALKAVMVKLCRRGLASRAGGASITSVAQHGTGGSGDTARQD